MGSGISYYVKAHLNEVQGIVGPGHCLPYLDAGDAGLELCAAEWLSHSLYIPSGREDCHPDHHHHHSANASSMRRCSLSAVTRGEGRGSITCTALATGTACDVLPQLATPSIAYLAGTRRCVQAALSMLKSAL